MTKEENAMELLKQLEDLFEGKEEMSHMTGDIHLCGITADEVLKQIKEKKR